MRAYLRTFSARTLVGLAALSVATPALGQTATATADSLRAAEEKKQRENADGSRERPYRLKERITVVGAPARSRGIPGSVQRITREELAAQNQAYDDVHRVMMRRRGVSSASPGFTTVKRSHTNAPMISSELMSGNQLATSAPAATAATASQSRAADCEECSSWSTARSVAPGSVCSPHLGQG